MSSLQPYPVAMAAYALLLLGIAVGLETLARHVHARSDRFRTAGFTYHPAHDAWICPENEWLRPHEHDHELRLIRYRARPVVCNACPAKHACTDSSEGRELVRPLDPWPHSEAARFHRGMALVPVALALVVDVIGLASGPNLVSLAVLLLPLALGVALGLRFVAAFSRTRINAPASQGRGTR